jgi:hypothetical protein
LKCDDTRAETRFRLSAKRTSPFKSAGASVQSTAGNRGVRISGSNAGCTMFRGSVKSTGYPLDSPVSLSLPLPCVTVCRHISTGIYQPSHNSHITGKIYRTYLLTPYSRVPLEKLTGPQLVKKFPELYGTRRFITAFTNEKRMIIIIIIIVYFYYYYYLISHFSVLAGKYSPILGFSNQQE